MQLFRGIWAYLDIVTTEVILDIRVLEILGPDYVARLATSTQDISLDGNVARSLDSDSHITIGSHGSRRSRLRVRFRIVRRDVPRSWLRGRVCDDLEEARNVPVAIDGVVCLGRGDVQRDIMGLPVCQDWHEGSEVEEVRGEIERAVRGDGSEKYHQGSLEDHTS